MTIACIKQNKNNAMTIKILSFIYTLQLDKKH